ncbi:MAG TPA: 1-deoxy-D-xylulose-5-phosphate synthase [Candidatus Omnitrophota bacterium]|nr:1-deoxy-D-xylulose-5-phosphate synthase [Candidatus Omnitrophota bacterium]
MKANWKNNMLLEHITGAQDVRKLKPEQLSLLAQEVRLRMLEVVCRTGGHLASSLGAVELIVALHYCLDTPRDKIIFDVGHQAYAHKILTGRNKEFATLRQAGGISGFPSRDESDYDTFYSGHSSTAVSQALGLACARDYLAAQESFRVVAVIGDGSLSGGICFEGLNNAGHLKKDMLVVLNTNELSIAPNVGAISTYLNKLISLPIYNRFRGAFDNFLESRVPRGRRLKAMATKFEEGLKGLFIPGMLFEELGFRYFGPLDGHNIEKLIPTLKNILSIKGPKLLHVITKKGKGYAPAENNPVRFHGVGPFELSTGRALGDGASPEKTFTRAFSDTMLKLAGTDDKLVAITAAMPEGTGLDGFRDAHPKRFFDVGIAEEHALCFAAGLCAAGLRPVVALYSTFMQRAFDQIVEDIALQHLPVIIALDRAGIVGEDGVTHQGIFDIAGLRMVPNLVLMAPMDGVELEMMFGFAAAGNAATVIRYPKGVCSTAGESGQPRPPIALGKPQILREGKAYVIFALGSMVYPAWEAAELLAAEGLSGTVVNSRFAKPLDRGLIKQIAARAPHIFTIEEGILEGGFGSAVMETLGLPVVRMGLPGEFIAHGKRSALLEKYGLTAAGIARGIKESIRRHD